MQYLPSLAKGSNGRQASMTINTLLEQAHLQPLLQMAIFLDELLRLLQQLCVILVQGEVGGAPPAPAGLG